MTNARLLSAGRVVIGAAMVVAPGTATGTWIGGDEASRPATKVLTRAFGAREVLLGMLTAHVAGRPGVGRRTLSAVGTLDAFDAAISLVFRRSLPARGVAAIALLAGGSAVDHLWTSRRLPPA